MSNLYQEKLGEVALRFLNSLHDKNSSALEHCLALSGLFQDVLPNGTVVKSSAELMQLHIGFMQANQTGFRPFNRDIVAGEWRRFTYSDFEYFIAFESGYFCRVAAEVDRPVDFRIVESDVAKYYMHLGILIKDNVVVHVQNTPFDPKIQAPH